MQFKLDKLPYEPDELEPYISADTVDVHYRKHHAGYLEKLAHEIEGKQEADLPLDEVVRTAEAEGSVFRNAAQVWNHTFYWSSLAPDGGGSPDGVVADLLKRDFGSVDAFKRQLAEAAKGEFGSGWAWLAADTSGRLEVLSTTDADNPMRDGFVPILTLDVWEHAYYLDYKNEREKYVEACLDHLLNWQFAEVNIGIAAAAAGDVAATASLNLAYGR
jgi:Fe-Mn family superoxide dismutase